MGLIFNNAATCHAYESGEGYLLISVSESPRRRKQFLSFLFFSLQLLPGGSAYIPTRQF